MKTLEKKVGSIEKNMVADILIWNVEALEKIVTKILIIFIFEGWNHFNFSRIDCVFTRVDNI